MKIIDITNLKITLPSYASETKRMMRLKQGPHAFDYIEAGADRPDFVIISKNAEMMGNGIPCPVCLLRALEIHQGALHLDEFGHILYPDTKAPSYSGGDVKQLHWGWAGTTGVCYQCLGSPDDEPVW